MGKPQILKIVRVERGGAALRLRLLRWITWVLNRQDWRGTVGSGDTGEFFRQIELAELIWGWTQKRLLTDLLRQWKGLFTVPWRV